MNSQTHSHRVTIEDCVDQDDIQQRQSTYASNQQLEDIDLSQVNNNSQEQASSFLPRGNSKKRQQSWDEVDELEELARSEKLQDQPQAIAKAQEAAKIVQEAASSANQQQNSSVY